MHFPRESGILLHPTSLPGPYGMGEAGPQALAWVDRLKAMGQRLWQVLPLGPTGYGDSPYQALSSFAGNHLLIAFDWLVADKLLDPDRLAALPTFDDHAVDYGTVVPARMALLAEVCAAFHQRASAALEAACDDFCAANAAWLDDYALYAALKDAHDGRAWVEWAPELARRDPDALDDARARYAEQIRAVKVRQFLFDRHWRRVKDYCRQRGIRLVGDVPIFVAHDSADVWARPDLFHLDEGGQPTVVAGVPPDYFSATGQRWGNPLYRWKRMAEEGFEWWRRRLARTFEHVDIVRLDHFRGFEAYWEIPADEPDATQGRWVPGPRDAFFRAMREALGRLPFLAEDLGVITPQVDALRERFGLPGIRLLQFAFGNDPKADAYKPHNYVPDAFCYTGTHDNDTTVGWFYAQEGEGTTRSQAQIDAEREAVLAYTGSDGSAIHWDFIELALRSVANTVIVPLQDVLGLGSEARMNLPGRPSGNWRWRFTWEMLDPAAMERLRRLSEETGRLRGSAPPAAG